MKIVFFALCLLSCLKGVSFDLQQSNNNKIPLNIGENITLHTTANNSIVKVLWAKRNIIFLTMFKNGTGNFLNKAFQSRVCSLNISSITICNATSEDTGQYQAYIKFPKEFITKRYYIEEHSDFCDLTSNVNATKGTTVHLLLKRFKSRRGVRWVLDNGNEILFNDSASNKYTISKDDSQLTLNNITEEDEGFYTVILENPETPDCNHTYIVSIIKNATTDRVHLPEKDISTILIVVFVCLFLLLCFVAGPMIYKRRQRSLNRRNRDHIPVATNENEVQDSNPAALNESELQDCNPEARNENELQDRNPAAKYENELQEMNHLSASSHDETTV